MAKMNQHQLNEAIKDFITAKDAKHAKYTDEDKAYIRQFSGSGGQGKHGATGEGVLYEFYTPEYIVKYMWDLAYMHGYDGTGTVLEPSCATGELLRPAPDKSLCYGFEINHYSKRIAEILYPEAHFYEGYFETAFLKPPRFTVAMRDPFTWLEGYPFSLLIGNPPYGKYKNFYSSYFSSPKMKQIELFFMCYGLKMLKPGGLLVYLVSSNFLRNGISYSEEKLVMEQLGAELVDAYRLPPVFANSDVPVDIVVFKKNK
jgi:type I restriction-modification system DNA methylase subunit